jgi:hypothetical protein
MMTRWRAPSLVPFLCVASSTPSARPKRRAVAGQPTRSRSWQSSLDLSTHSSKSAATIDPATIDVVMTLWVEDCPLFLGAVRRLQPTRRSRPTPSAPASSLTNSRHASLSSTPSDLPLPSVLWDMISHCRPHLDGTVIGSRPAPGLGYSHGFCLGPAGDARRRDLPAVPIIRTDFVAILAVSETTHRIRRLRGV